MTVTIALDEMRDLLAEKRWAEALEWADERGVDESDDVELVWNSGWACCNLERPARAVVLFRRAVALDPSRLAGYWGLGLAYRECGLLEEAEEILETGLGVRESPLARKLLERHPID